MKKKPKEDLIDYRIEKAKDTLEDAEIMMQNNSWNAAVNRLYYACYYAVSALLVKHNISAQTHNGTRQMFGLHFVHSGKISREYGKFYTDLFDKRQTGDYEDYIEYDEETLDYLFPRAKKFIQLVEALTKK